MKPLLILLTSLLLPHLTSAQQANNPTKYQDTVFIKHDSDWAADKLKYVTDTVIFESGMRRQILLGTTVLPGTHNQAEALEYGLFFMQVEKSKCLSHDEDDAVPDHINTITLTDTSLTVDMNITDNCCYEFLCDIAIVDGTILNLIYYGYGTHCSCDCCFGLTYQMQRSKDSNFKKLRSVMINGDRKMMKNIK